MDINKHKSFLVRILKDIYEDISLCSILGFKGGTALMLFYGLPRFSVDLDFDLLAPDKTEMVYAKLRTILLKYGKIDDEAIKHYGIIMVLNYGSGERMLKIEISTRLFENRYEIKYFLGIGIKAMARPDMFSHKLCALLDRKAFTNRDLFDCWFFLDRQTPLNRKIVEMRTGMPLEDYLQKCIDFLEKMSSRSMLQGIGELVDEKIKVFVKNSLRKETIALLKIYKEMPVLNADKIM